MDGKSNSLYSFPEEIVLNQHRKNRIFQELMQDFSIEKIKDDWNQEMDEKSLTSANFTYGEADFLSLAEIFDLIKTRHGPIPSGGKFYDLGSGSGKAVVAAALLHDFSSCEGIEILESLFKISEEMNKIYQQTRLHLIYTYPDLWTSLPDIHFSQGDMFDFVWSDASLIFINSTCFDSKMMDKLSSTEVNPGAWAVTLTKPLKSPLWKVQQSLRKPMSWGEATVYIHQRI